jgi:predicted transcriptional regulator
MGLWSVLVGVFLLGAATSVVRSVRSPTVVRDAMSPPIALEPDWPISKLINEVLPLHRQISFPVAQNRRLLGILLLEDVKKIPRERWSMMRVRDTMRMVNSQLFVPENATIDSVNQLMAHNGVGAVAVINPVGELVGFFRRANGQKVAVKPSQRDRVERR